MRIPTLDEPLCRLTTNILVLLLHATSHRRGNKVAYGLPAGSVCLNDVNLILAATPCDAPLFQDAMRHAAAATGANVILARHGMHPETLNEVSFSVLIHDARQPYLLSRMVLFRASTGEYWLINSEKAAFIAIDPMGLRISHAAPFRSLDEKSAGFCAAAAEIMRAARFTVGF